VLPSFRPWLQSHRDELDAIVFDVDGVLMTARHPTPGSGELIDRLRADDVPFALLTNDGCHSPEEKTELLRSCGMEFSPGDIVSASHGLVELAAERNWAGKQFFVMGYLGNPCYAERAGLRSTCDADALCECAGAIVGEKKYDWEEVITAVFNFLIAHSDAPLIVPNPDEYFPGSSVSLHVASGAVGRFLQQLCRTYGHDVQPVYLGKPYAPIFLYNHHRIEKQLGRQVAHERVMIVGDSLASDIRGGLDFGYRTALVLTGITPRHMLSRSLTQPELVFETL